MATLVLTAAGLAIGGPIGGAIGAIAGQSIDQRLFGPKARHGPRLGSLAVQTSSYGTAIPKIFGTMRVAGTVIWSTDLIERRSTSGGGKSAPKTVHYSYSASFAVALSGRPVQAVRRIWADGKLLRGAAGDFKTATGFRLHTGGEDQAADPLIVSAEGMGQAPAYRGIAYAVFEDFQLADYGNRIPSLTFEVVAEEAPVAIGAIAEELSGGALESGTTPALMGYAASGDSVRGAIEALSDVLPLSLADDGAALRLFADGETPVVLASADLAEKPSLARRAAGTIPGEAGIAYHDPALDFQTGLQRASRGDRGASRNADLRALPAALAAGAAKALAEHRLAALWAGRSTAGIELGWRHAWLRPGDRVALEGEAGRWAVARWTLGPMNVKIELRRSGPDLPAGFAEASAGSPVSQSDLPHGPTLLGLFDLPLGDGLATGSLLHVAASGGEGWRGAALSASFDGGESWRALGATAAPAVMGTAAGVLPPGGPALIDAMSSVEVVLASDSLWIEGRSDAAMIGGGANLAVLGKELIQFGAAEPLGDRRFRLSRLLRGRRGTEWAAGLHEAGELFLLVDPASLVAVEGPVGGEARVMGIGVGDLEAPAEASVAVEGAAVRPPSPVHLSARETAGGDLILHWVRRSRQGWAWSDGIDAPLGEEREAYRIVISGPGFTRTAEAVSASHVYTAAERAADGPGPIEIAVSQTGTFAPSRPAILIHP